MLAHLAAAGLLYLAAVTSGLVAPPGQLETAADWPMYRYDAGRTAASPLELPGTLHLQWVRELPPLKPAWPDQVKMQLDAVYEPIVLGKLLLVGSSRTDCLTAYDTATGAEQWRFHVEGPIRYAPAGWKDRVFVAADDGYLYCLKAASGALLWKFRGGPSDRKVLGNGRLVSTWPARGAPVVAEGKVYFAASIWPFMGIFMHCLDADTGAVVWTNDGDGAVYMKQPHSAEAFAGVAPQGPLVVAGDRLLVPGGRSIPAVLDRKTGKWLRYQLAENGKKGGGALVATLGNQFFNGGAVFQIDTEKHLGSFGDLVVLTPQTGYGYSAGVLKAYDMPTSKEEVEESVDRKGEKTKTTKWSVKTLATVKVPQLEALIKSGSRLFAGRPGEVLAFDLPLGNASVPSWTAKIDGTPASVVSADGKLFVVTREGSILCFGPKPVEPTRHPWTPKADPPTQAAVDRVASILEATKVKAGYVVVWGAGNGDFVLALARHEALRLIVIESDAAKAHQLRDRLAAAGLFAERVSVYIGEPRTFALPPYLASLMVAAGPVASDGAGGLAFIEQIWNALRPYGGAALLPLTLNNIDVDRLEHQLPANLDIKVTKGSIQVVRKGPLPGAGNWTHEHGDAANTRVARDQIVKAPLGVLWFGGPSHDGILPRHGHGPMPQVIDGRCIIEGVDMLRAIDIYTGRLLWETKLPGVGFFYNNLLHQPGANSSGGNYVCMPDGIYVVLGSSCLRLDPETGKQMAEFRLPPSPGSAAAPRWGYINVVGDSLVGGADPLFDEKLFKSAVLAKDDKGLADDNPGKKDDSVTKLLKSVRAANDNFSSSKHLVVMDRHTGKVLWTASAQCGFRHNAICAGGGRLYCIDRLSGLEWAKLKRRAEEPKIPPRLVVFDLKTGEQLWSTDANIFGTWLSYSAKYDVLVEAGRVARDTIVDEPKGMRAYDAARGNVLWYDAKYAGPAMIHDRTILKDTSACDLLTGAPKMRPHPLTGELVPWEWTRNYGCNTPAASEHLLTFRSGAAGFYDLCHDGGTGNLGGFRSSCTNNLIVAGGVLTAPDYTRTCSCLYQNQTSLGLIHMPEAELWTFFGSVELKGVVRRVGISLGAPGDRRADNGTLWLEFPSTGGKSPSIDVKVAGRHLEWFRRHPSAVQGPLPWVAASGVKGLGSLNVQLARGTAKPRKYTVRLVFAEPDNLPAGKRLFDVAIQGKEVLSGFDVAKEAGGAGRSLVREFKGILAREEIAVRFAPTAGAEIAVPLLCGIEILAEEPAEKQ
jgi:outer membrane protein assembly factor BamB